MLMMISDLDLRDPCTVLVKKTNSLTSIDGVC